MKLSIVIPARNEADTLAATLLDVHQAVVGSGIPHEILVVNDHSADRTQDVVDALAARIPTLRSLRNQGPGGFGMAVRAGLDNHDGGAVAIVMADGSDSPQDLVRFYRKLLEGYDCVFGSRFIEGGRVVGYPAFKRVLNRTFNYLVSALFGIRYNDCTNAFKMYRSEVIAGLRPFLSHQFNLTVELPLKAIVRGYSYAILPNSWRNRKAGVSKLRIKEMGSRYFFILIYCFIEKWLCAEDYAKAAQARRAADVLGPR